MKDRIVSGIQPTGELHIGNYLATLKDFVSLQDQFECFFFVADLHSLSENFDPAEKRRQIQNLMATFLASGVDPEKCTLFIQSQVPAHTELFAILNNLVPMGELERMTQFKDKAARQSANINAGLFEYPVLMAADIMLYKPTHVPVGHDQLQHLELTNTIIRKFNHRFGETFREIQAYQKKPLRIMSLADPERKMGKSDPGSCINMFDGPAEIQKKLAKAVTATDASAKDMPRGVQNLIELLEHFDNAKAAQHFRAAYATGSIKYSELKTVLAETLAAYFAPMREKRQALDQTPKLIDEAIQVGASKAARVAEKTLAEVKEKIGLI